MVFQILWPQAVYSSLVKIRTLNRFWQQIRVNPVGLRPVIGNLLKVHTRQQSCCGIFYTTCSFPSLFKDNSTLVTFQCLKIRSQNMLMVHCKSLRELPVSVGLSIYSMCDLENDRLSILYQFHINDQNTSV